MSIEPTPRQEKTDETKRKLTQTAFALFAEYNYDVVTIDDICKRAGLTKGAFYHNFGSKENLVVLSYNRQLDEYITSHFALEDTAPLSEQLYDLYMTVLDFAERMGKPATRRSYLAQINSCVYLKIPGRAYVDSLIALVDRGLRENAFRAPLSDIEAYMLLTGTFTGLLLEWSTHEEKPDIPDWRSLIRTQLSLILA